MFPIVYCSTTANCDPDQMPLFKCSG